MQQQAESHEL